MGLAIDAYITGGYVDRALAQEYRRMAEVAERALREKMEAEAVKRDLTNMIVHDLKAPIGGILTVTQLALRKRGAIPEAHARRFEHIDRSARDLLRMIENLLEIDQLQEGRMELRVEPVDVARLLEECAEEFRPAAEAEGQHLRIQVADDVPVIAADRWLLRRVLNNLVTNAIRHSGSKGAIDLVAERAGDSVHLMVRDSGRGIPREEQALLFTKHRRRGRRTGSREDTGLGLVFCRLAVEAMGGSIGVTSAEGQGATFTVALPAAPNGS
jgi:signal transduction histidine kinase